MLTAGQIVTNVIRYYLSVADNVQFRDPDTRARANFLLRGVMARAWTYAPAPFRTGSGTVAITANGYTGTCPADYSTMGPQARVLVSASQPYELDYIEEGKLLALIQTQPSASAQPQFYTHLRNTAAGLHQIGVWPKVSANTTLLLEAYHRRCLEPIDFPGKFTVAVGAAGALTGVYRWRATFVWADGETEAGYESEALTLAAQRATLTGIPVSPWRGVTARRLYRTQAGGSVYYLLATLADNTTTTYSDNVADGSLGITTSPPTPDTALTGTEQFPDDFHETVLYEGLKAKMMETQGDLRDAQFWVQFERNVRRMWADARPGQNVTYRMPAYGQMPEARPLRDRLRGV